MLITNERHPVTHQMMEELGMTRGLEYGIPVDPKNPSKGFVWKTFLVFEESDYDKLEEYFLLNQPTTK